MRNDIDFKEYSRLRDIAHKRIQRLQKAGFDADIYLPTVKEVRASENPYYFMRELRNFVNAPTTVKEVRLQKTAKPVVHRPNFPTVPQIRKETELEKQIRKKAQKKKSRVNRAVKKSAPEGKSGRFTGYLKAAEKIAERWIQAGKLSGDMKYMENAKFVLSMTPAQAKAFVAYTEYRFSQGDFEGRYTIVRFVEDFIELANKGVKLNSLQADFDRFLADQNKLSQHRADTEKYGIPAGEMLDLWSKFIKD